MRKNHTKILLYSHDTYGLGHLRRCYNIAKAIVAYNQDVSILIITGSRVAGLFEYPNNVDFVKIPGVVKTGKNQYATQSLNVHFAEVIKIRHKIITSVAKEFKPHIFIVDKEALGLCNELLGALEYLKSIKSKIILGLRDILDSPDVLSEEWRKKKTIETISYYYKQIYIYGRSFFYNTLQGLNLDANLQKLITYVGYMGPIDTPPIQEDTKKSPYYLVTSGGGQDGN
ncbi:MAG: hypothetical protein AAF518_02315, partial [Spirochaetota bacterium]